MRSSHLGLVVILGLTVACGSDGGNDNNTQNTNNSNNTGTNNVSGAPRVVSISPEDGATDVALDVVAQITFEGRVDPASVNFDTVWIEASDGKVRAEVTFDQSTASIRPDADLEPLTEYEVVVTRDVVGPEGDALISARRAAFTTAEAVALEEMTVLSTRPEDGARDVRVNTQIGITYESIVDESTVDAQSFRVVDTFDNPVEGEFLVDELNIFFTPDENLVPMQTYFVTVTDDVRGIEGKVGGHTWSFSTIPAIEFIAAAPADESDNADIDAPLILTLSSETDLDTSNDETISVHAETFLNGTRINREPVAADFSVSGNTIIIEPQDGRWREFRTLYHVELDGVLSSAGAPLPLQEVTFATTMFDSDWLYAMTSASEASALAVDGSTGAYQNTAFMAQNASDPTAQWGLDRNDDGSYLVTNPASGLSLRGATVVNTADPTSVVALEATDEGAASQRWEFEAEAESGDAWPMSPFFYRVKNQEYDMHSLGILDLSGVYRAYLLEDEDTDAQRWSFENVGPR